MPHKQILGLPPGELIQLLLLALGVGLALFVRRLPETLSRLEMPRVENPESLRGVLFILRPEARHWRVLINALAILSGCSVATALSGWALLWAGMETANPGFWFLVTVGTLGGWGLVDSIEREFWRRLIQWVHLQALKDHG